MNRSIALYRIAVVGLLLVIIAQSGWIIGLLRRSAPSASTISSAPAATGSTAPPPVVWSAGGSSAEIAPVPAASPANSELARQTEFLAHILRARDMPWATSADGKLALRVTSDASIYPKARPVKVLVEVRNASATPIWACIPNFSAGDVKIDSGGGVVPYNGPVPSPAAPQLQWLQPGEVIRSSLELRIDQFTGLDNAATYHIRLRYACDSTVKSLRAEAWSGAIDSLPVEIQRL